MKFQILTLCLFVWLPASVLQAQVKCQDNMDKILDNYDQPPISKNGAYKFIEFDGTVENYQTFQDHRINKKKTADDLQLEDIKKQFQKSNAELTASTKQCKSSTDDYAQLKVDSSTTSLIDNCSDSPDAGTQKRCNDAFVADPSLKALSKSRAKMVDSCKSSENTSKAVSELFDRQVKMQSLVRQKNVVYMCLSDDRRCIAMALAKANSGKAIDEFLKQFSDFQNNGGPALTEPVLEKIRAFKDIFAPSQVNELISAINSRAADGEEVGRASIGFWANLRAKEDWPITGTLSLLEDSAQLQLRTKDSAGIKRFDFDPTPDSNPLLHRLTADCTPSVWDVSSEDADTGKKCQWRSDIQAKVTTPNFCENADHVRLQLDAASGATDKSKKQAVDEAYRKMKAAEAVSRSAR